eukprot:CAMPEP_0197832508 /NCGR_PEP_ID=MMETSP1437-20131217/15113_1 /TAXON_ID=49252 ORGANISM="Eucampia antarctica, Strain CCMP1452" /NCGR_SAMPLE_ID=MMETSP1437 /ASSEMBLY_ACC=CAM_ASM_001096 /LENGTH=401 /DNA_ID=CAMNT_0043435923 /DNA_START=47 /DNA_END=1252 /DNA_ORIENTATION=+
MIKSSSLSIILAAFLSTSASAFGISNHYGSQTIKRAGSSLSMSSALIIQNKGGGHGELGFQIAKALELNEKITSVTILQDDACNDEREPFKSYGSDIPNVNIVKTSLADESMTSESLKEILGGKSFEYVWDNASKGPVGSGKAICDCAKEWDTKLLTYVSSAGIYQPTGEFPMPETTPVKESAGQNQYDNYAVELGVPLVSFRPQYIYGKKASKNDYLDWFFDRLVRELPLPIPSSGSQKVSLTNSEDVASLLTAALGNEEAAIEQRFFNCGTDQIYTYDEVAYMCAEAAGISKDNVNIEHYDHESLGKATFPFRMTDFYVAPDTAKDKLGWGGPKDSLKDDLKWYYEGYVQRGGSEKKMDLAKDWEIVIGSKTYEDDGSIYQKWNPVELDISNIKELNVE